MPLVNDSNLNCTWWDKLDPAMREVTPDFWLQFEPPPMHAQYIMGTLSTIILSLGMAINLTVIWLFFTTKKLKKPSNFLTINLAFCDFIMLHKMVIFIYNSFSGGPAAGVFWCTYYGLIGGLSGTSGIMTIAMMSVERFVCISRPLDPYYRMTTSRARIVIAFVWLYAAGFSFSPLFGINRYVPEGYLTSCSFDYLADDYSSKAFILVFFGAAYCLPVSIISFCYCGIVFSVRRNRRRFVDAFENSRNVAMEVRLAKTSFALVSLWTVAWTPYAAVALAGVFGGRTLITPLRSMLPAVFCKIASVLDPFVYGLSNRQFKKEFARKCLCFCKSKRRRHTVRERTARL